MAVAAQATAPMYPWSTAAAAPYGMVPPAYLPPAYVPPVIPGANGTYPFFPPWGVNPYSLFQPYYMKRNPTYDYLNT